MYLNEKRNDRRVCRWFADVQWQSRSRQCCMSDTSADAGSDAVTYARTYAVAHPCTYSMCCVVRNDSICSFYVCFLCFFLAWTDAATNSNSIILTLFHYFSLTTIIFLLDNAAVAHTRPRQCLRRLHRMRTMRRHCIPRRQRMSLVCAGRMSTKRSNLSFDWRIGGVWWCVSHTGSHTVPCLCAVRSI